MEIVEGKTAPLGFSIQDKVANFALFSSHADKVSLALFKEGHPIKEILLKRSGEIWHVGIKDLPKGLEYAYRCEGSKEFFCNSGTWLTDPYAKRVESNRGLAEEPSSFDWQSDGPPQIPKENLIIYEMHVRGFTKDISSKVAHPGTYLGIVEKIPYLKQLGVNAVELMPIFCFDQNDVKSTNPEEAQKGVNYWGYNSLHFFAPMNWYAEKDPILEFKTMVRELHKNGIEVILDVVYNHTGESPHLSINFRGIDNSVYYMLDDEGNYLDFTGCGNTVNANHPIVQTFILDSLRYWVQEMHVDGFRFDLASTFTRDPKGTPLEHPPLLEAMANDPVLSQVKLIAEAWDAAGLYQIGSFPNWGPWSEWNGKYRDIVRNFIKGTEGCAGLFANALCGSEWTYWNSKTPLSSVNFITAHDGYTLKDLVSYQEKHNLDNGENNQDGNDANDSWNCGTEGPTQDVEISNLRERQMRNFLLALFISQGIPMLLMGDEYGHTRNGNNNPYVQDNELNWFLWNRIDEKIFKFISKLIAFRLENKQLRRNQFLSTDDVNWHTNFEQGSPFIAFQLNGKPSFFIAFNAQSKTEKMDLPEGTWHTVVNTAEDWEFHTKGETVSSIELIPYSALIAKQD